MLFQIREFGMKQGIGLIFENAPFIILLTYHLTIPQYSTVITVIIFV